MKRGQLLNGGFLLVFVMASRAEYAHREEAGSVTARFTTAAPQEYLSGERVFQIENLSLRFATYENLQERCSRWPVDTTTQPMLSIPRVNSGTM
jgi:hypothetical protein